MFARISIAVIASLSGTGCGLILHRPTQNIAVTSAPPGATVSSEGQQKTAPATLEVKRGELVIVRASAPGYVEMCEALVGRKNRAMFVFDIIFAAIPLAVDAITSGQERLYGFPGEVTFDLAPKGKFEALRATVPSDEEIRQGLLENRDLCAEARTPKRALDLVLTTGPISVRYEILGSVSVKAEGREAARAARPLFLFRAGGLPASEPEHEVVAALLRLKATQTYGDQVDALINVSYHGEPRSGDVSAEGLAVKFVK